MNLHKLWVFTGTILVIFLVFFTWKESYPYHCLSLIFPIMMLATVSYGYYEFKKKERECFRDCYFKSDTVPSRFLSSRSYIIMIFYLLVSILMTISTFMISIEFPRLLWFYFIIHVLLSMTLFIFLTFLFGKIFKEKHQLLFAREWTVNIMAVIIIVVFIYISLNEYTPAYLSNSLQQTVNTATASVFSNCDVTNTSLKYGKAIDSSFWWITNESAEQIDNTLIKSIIWIGFVAYNSFALLGINRFMILIIYYLDTKILKNKREI